MYLPSQFCHHIAQGFSNNNIVTQCIIIHDACFLSYFEKIAHYVSGLSVCISVVLCVQISVTGANNIRLKVL